MEALKRLLRPTFWKVVFVLVVAAGLYATWLRFAKGLGAATALSDRFPWGIWIGFDILCGVGLAAGGFTMAAAVHIFRVKRFEAVVRPAILTAFLGYVLVVFALMFDLGRPWVVWHPLVMWNPHSVMFEVAWCVMLYTTVLALEFSPMVFERLGWGKALRRVHRALPYFVVLGVLLSTLHQSSLGSLYLIVPTKLHPLWYTPLLPIQFFLSAAAIGSAMVLFESRLSGRAFGHELPAAVRVDLSRVMMVLLVPFALLRLADLSRRGVLGLAFEPTMEAFLFQVEFSLGVVLPIILVAIRRVRHAPQGPFFAAICAILGFVTHRLNVSITGMDATQKTGYFPAWTELAVTMMIVAVGFAAFALAVKFLPVFRQTGEEPEGEGAPVEP
ncbi:MAG: Ni/Fe-hydrogenase cytochrome b subunit [Deltaproteobacteria bacterium]|nr:Ni/Fe-hydrogenase cytochrome b subunit [Deltaproteobacteria bacterium]